MIPELMTQKAHRRLNPLTGEWVLVSPHRTERPWQGKVGRVTTSPGLPYDPACYLCPGNPRAGGEQNPKYKSTFVFANDFAALDQDTPRFRFDEGKLLVGESESGICRVVCFSPRHDLTLARMNLSAIREVVDLWAAQSAGLGSQPAIQYVQIFENRGEIMGCSNPHPHGQIWANETIPNEARREQARQLEYLQMRNSCLLCDYIAIEQKSAERVVCENNDFIAVVPFWAVWPYEILLVAKSHARDLTALGESSRGGLAGILKRMTTRYDNLFETSFSYSMGFHQAPTDNEPHSEWHLHAHFYPPLLRSATIRKFMVGYELLAAPQRDILPELAAERLGSMSEIHYLDRI